MVKTFDAKETRFYDLTDGSILHCEVKIDDTIIMIGDSGNDNPDAIYKKALDAGGLSVEEPSRKKDDPDRRAGVKDPAGNSWWITTQVD